MAAEYLVTSVGENVLVRTAMDRVLQRTGFSANSSGKAIAELSNVAKRIKDHYNIIFFDYLARGFDNLSRARAAAHEERRLLLERALDEFKQAVLTGIDTKHKVVAGLDAQGWVALAAIGLSTVFAARSEEEQFEDAISKAKASDAEIYDLFIDDKDRTEKLIAFVRENAGAGTGERYTRGTATSESPFSRNTWTTLIIVGALVAAFLGGLFGWSIWRSHKHHSYKIHGQTSSISIGSEMVTIYGVQSGGTAGIYYENQGSLPIHITSTFACASQASCQVEGSSTGRADFTVPANGKGHVVIENANQDSLVFDSTISVEGQ
jgi:hypothetical protein